MGKRGPAPKPVEEKIRQGTYRPSRDNLTATVTMPVAAPPRPPGLEPKARLIWDQVVPELLEVGTLAKVDGGILEAYCRTLARAATLDGRAARQPVIEIRGRRVDGKPGPIVRVQVNPAGVEARKLWPIVEKLASDLGLHYAARTRVPPPKKPDETDPVEEFLFGPRKSRKPAGTDEPAN